ncbi:ladderlectin-like [Atheta coriaria]|uniref:ladderlectin-like n=1 Tax=Dalotia coriaria TaxID=877792 RepID=UPI0031F46083
MYFLKLTFLASLLLATSAENIGQHNTFQPTQHESLIPVLSSNRTYKIISIDQKTWFGALHACHFMGLELASITSKEDEENLAQVIKDECIALSSRWWISGNDLDTEESFFWASNGHPFTYTNWEVGQPNHSNHDQRCVYIVVHIGTDPVWNDYNCYNKYRFICEI